MEYKDSMQKSSELTRMVIHMLSKLQIPVNPISFAVWYEYFLSRSEGLRKELEPIANEQMNYTPELGQQLFLRYIVTSDIEKLEKIEQEVFLLLNNIIKIIAHTGVDVSKYSEVLHSSKKCLTRTEDVHEVKRVLEAIIHETDRMSASNSNFERKLRSTSEEIESLRQELSKVREEASQDTLTGLANRKIFDAKLAESLDLILKGMKSVCLLMIDIDHFKHINDTHGHIIGDQVIKFVADTLKQSVKGRDLVARYGGEEFGVVLQETPLRGAVVLAEEIRQKVENSQLKQRGTGKLIDDVTISIGIDTAKQSDTPESLINRADKALYHSKRTGRNKVSCLNPEYPYGT